MLKFCYDHRGSISIFLLVIITAMLFFSFMTLDIAKMNLATAAARNNADLVGNAALTDYDKLLKDAYGLFANSGDINELSKNVSDYYIATMSAGGVEIKDKNEIYAAISGLLNDAEIPKNNNMLQIKTSSLTLGSETSSSGVIIQPINESAISNPSVMRHQIVEYMKYRAPVNLATGMLEKINVFKDLGNQTAATTDRIEYEDALNKVQTSSDVVYEVLNAYDNNIKEISAKNYPANAWIKYGAKEVRKISGKAYGKGAKALHDSYNNLVKWFVNYSPLKDESPNGILTSKKVEITPKNPANGVSDLLGIINGIENNDDYEYLKQQYNQSYGSASILVDMKKYDSKTYNFLKAAKSLYDGSLKGVNITGSVSGDIARFYVKFYELYYGLLEESEKFTESQWKEFNANKSSFEETDEILSWAFGYPKVKTSSESITHKESTTGSVDECVSTMYITTVNAYETYVDCMYDITATIYYQKEMASYMSGTDSPLDDLKDEIASAKKKSEEWKNSISKVQTESYKASMQNTYNVESENFDKLDPNAVELMKNTFGTHFAQYSADYNNVIDFYGSVFGYKMYEEIKKSGNNSSSSLPEREFETFESHEIPVFLENMDIPSDLSYEAILSGAQKGDTVQLKAGGSAYSTTLNMGSNKQIYEIVKKISEKNIILNKKDRENLKKQGEEDKKKVNSKKESLEKDQKEQEEKSIGKEPSKSEKESGNYTGSMKDVSGVTTFEEYIKSNATTQYGYGVSLGGANIGNMDADKDGNYDTSNVTGILSQIGDMFVNIAKASRDNLFVVEYLTGSFSCMTTGVKDGEETPEKSMTGYVFSKENNKHYQAELEYILYGHESEFANKAAAIATISAIRFALNLIYSFTDKEINMFTTSTASSLGAIFPFAIPVIKTVLHVLISAAETSWDMLELTKGNSVPIYKSGKTWVCKGTNILGNVVSEVTEKVIKTTAKELEEGISDYIDGKADDLTEWTTKMVDQKKDEIKSLLDAKIVVPINETVTMLVADAKKSTDEIETALNNLVDTIAADITSSSAQETSGDSVMAGIYEKMASYLKENKSTIVSKVKGFISEAKKNAAGYLNDFEKKFKESMTSITEKIGSIVDSANEQIKKMVTEAADEVKKAAVNGIETGSDKLLSAVNSKISAKLSGKRNININMGSGSGMSGNSSALDSLLTMTYKDYLYLFLLLGMLNGSDKELTRAAQLMQCNIQHRGEKEYNINKAVTMFNVYTSSKVKTSIIGRYADSNGFTMKNLSDGYYNIEIRSFAGY